MFGMVTGQSSWPRPAGPSRRRVVGRRRALAPLAGRPPSVARVAGLLLLLVVVSPGGITRRLRLRRRSECGAASVIIFSSGTEAGCPPRPNLHDALQEETEAVSSSSRLTPRAMHCNFVGVQIPPRRRRPPHDHAHSKGQRLKLKGGGKYQRPRTQPGMLAEL
jgi:hypothetical protein